MDVEYERCVKKAVITLFTKKEIKKMNWEPVFLHVVGKKYSSGKKKYVADRAKTLLININ